MSISRILSTVFDGFVQYKLRKIMERSTPMATTQNNLLQIENELNCEKLKKTIHFLSTKDVVSLFIYQSRLR